MTPATGATKRAACPQPRLTLVLLSVILVITSGGQSGLSLYALYTYKHAIDLTAARIFLGIIGALTGIVCLATLGGVLGLILRRHKLIDWYSTSLYTLWIVTLAFGIANEIMLWRARDGFRLACPVETTLTFDACRKHFDYFFGLTMALWIISILVSSTLVSLARDYAKQLLRQRLATPQANGAAPDTETTDAV